MSDRLIATPAPSVLLVIGTFAAVPYVHLHLESRRRFYPDVPCLVHDDASPMAETLRGLCADYGAEYASPAARLPPLCGDLAATLLAIRSAAERGVDLAVKMSRRFVPLTNWVPQLQYTAYQTQYATYSNVDEGNNLGFRTECVAFHAPTWVSGDIPQRIKMSMADPEMPYRLVEPLLHNMAREIHGRMQCAANREYEELFPRAPGSNAYGIWHWLSHDRTRRHPSWLWHQADLLLDYARLSQVYCLPYRMDDFADPNMGHGQGYR